MSNPLINFVVLVISLVLTAVGAAFVLGEVGLFELVLLFLGGYGLGVTFPSFFGRLRGSGRTRRTVSATAARDQRGERDSRRRTKERPQRTERRQRPQNSKAKRAVRTKGTVKWFDESKGYGFITPEDGSKDCFVHRSVVPNGGSLAEGKKVEFEVIKDDRGRVAAANVVVL
jgi:CspA family cold shock protein